MLTVKKETLWAQAQQGFTSCPGEGGSWLMLQGHDVPVPALGLRGSQDTSVKRGEWLLSAPTDILRKVTVTLWGPGHEAGDSWAVQG